VSNLPGPAREGGALLPASGAAEKNTADGEVGRGVVRRLPHRLAFVVLLIGCLLTALLAWAAASANATTDHRLLKLQVRQAASVLSAALPSLVTPLTAAFDVAMATHDPQQFAQFIAPEVGKVGPFVSASLWRLSPGPPTPLVVVGTTPRLQTDGRADSFLTHVQPGGTVSVTPILPGTTPRVGYAVIPAGGTASEVVYAEIALPANQKAAIPKNSAFADLDFALYLGNHPDPAALIERTGPLSGDQLSASVPFGGGALTLVGSTTASLGGGLSAALPWVVGVFGAALAVLTALTTDYLIRRRRLAENLAEENAGLYVEQRTIAETLQRSLLPDRIPTVAGIDIAVRYAPGVGGIEVGGDWYDVIPTDDGGSIFVVGDVSGRGLGAATTMGFLRHAIRAYAVQGGGPAVILEKVGMLVGQADDGHFSTVLCGQIDVGGHLLILASAGHFAPLVIDGSGAHYAEVVAGPPVGVLPRSTPIETRTTVRPGATLVAFTDGLVERRGENLDIGLARLAGLATDGAADRPGGVDSLVGRLLAELTPDGSDDDIAILGVQWQA
jgi:serine phosphatase RsbU (regulator of sigma subunit)